jgi:hypothetical protein
MVEGAVVAGLTRGPLRPGASSAVGFGQPLQQGAVAGVVLAADQLEPAIDDVRRAVEQIRPRLAGGLNRQRQPFAQRHATITFQRFATEHARPLVISV